MKYLYLIPVIPSVICIVNLLINIFHTGVAKEIANHGKVKDHFKNWLKCCYEGNFEKSVEYYLKLDDNFWDWYYNISEKRKLYFDWYCLNNEKCAKGRVGDFRDDEKQIVTISGYRMDLLLLRRHLRVETKYGLLTIKLSSDDVATVVLDMDTENTSSVLVNKNEPFSIVLQKNNYAQ